MRNVLARLPISASLFAVFALTSIASAQMREHMPFRVDVPFDFIADKTPLPAGEYKLSALFDDVELISGSNGHIATMAPPVLEGAPGKNAMLIFHRVGEKYFLAEIWPAGSKVGRMVGGSETARRRRDPAITSLVTVIAGLRNKASDRSARKVPAGRQSNALLANEKAVH